MRIDGAQAATPAERTAAETAVPAARGTLSRVDAAVAAERIGEAVVLVHLETNQIFELNPTAARIYELLRDGADRAAVEAALAAEFDAPPATIAADLDRLLAELRERRIVR
jgi:PqqD family protein of HPr-rel-A system